MRQLGRVLECAISLLIFSPQINRKQVIGTLSIWCISTGVHPILAQLLSNCKLRILHKSIAWQNKSTFNSNKIVLFELTYWALEQRNILSLKGLSPHSYWNTFKLTTYDEVKTDRRFFLVQFYWSTKEFHFITNIETYCNFPGWCCSLGGAETEGPAGGEAPAGAGGATEDGSPASAGISTCFQSCPSSTSRPISEPKRTFLLPSST